MNRRILGSGAIVCSAMVIWAQHAAPEVGIDNCGNELATPPSAEKRSNRAQHCSDKKATPMISNAPGFLPLSALWSNIRGIQSSRLPGKMEAVYSKLLEQAQAAANRNQLVNAVASVAGIPKNSQHYAMAQQLQEDWSQELLQRATNYYQQADLARAIALLKAIPPTSQRYAHAAEMQGRWSQEAALFKQAAAARSARNWQGVINALKTLEGRPLYNTPPVQELLQLAMKKLFEPDAALMQLASATSESSTALAIPMTAPSSLPSEMDSLPASEMEALPSPSDLGVDVDRAMEWTQPATLPATPPSQSSGKVAATRKHSSMTSFPPFMSSIAPPESLPISRRQKAPISKLVAVP
jgi:hypothetical protein